MAGSSANVRVQAETAFGLNQKMAGIALFVGVFLVLQWSPILGDPMADAFREEGEPLKAKPYFWMAIPLSLLAVIGAILAVQPTVEIRARSRFLNRVVAGIVLFSGAMMLVEVNPGLFEITFDLDRHGLPWKTSYHWILLPLVAIGIAGAAIAVLPARNTYPLGCLFTRQAVGMLVFTAAYFIINDFPELAGRQWGGAFTYHWWGLVPVVIVCATGAAFAVMPLRRFSPSVDARPSRFAVVSAWALAAYPLLLTGWFYSYVLRQRLLLGYWPRPCHPDPQDAGLVFHHESMIYLWEPVPIMALGAIACIVALRHANGNFRWRWPQAIWVVSLGILIALAKFDPGRFIEWYWD